VIDKDGFRHGVGIVVVNQERQLLWAKRIGREAWQFPQGGIHTGETAEEAMYRELKEEIGLLPDHVRILAHSRRWLRYRLPRRLIRYYTKPLCVGQKQKWFLLYMLGRNQDVNLEHTASPEFDAWAWVPYWHPLREVVVFKQRVYTLALKEFARLVLSKRFQEVQKS